MKYLLIAASVGAFVAASSATAATLLQYDFTGQPGTETTVAATNVAAGLNGQAITETNLTPNAGGGSINARGWNTAGASYNLGLTVNSGFSVTVNQLVFGSQASNTGPKNIGILASIDGGAFTQVATYSFTAGATDLFQTVNLTPLMASSSLSFKFVAANQVANNNGTVASTGTFRLENGSASPFTIAGTVSAAVVPEPASWALMVAGFGLIGGALRSRKTVVRFA